MNKKSGILGISGKSASFSCRIGDDDDGETDIEQ
jgi:acetate kinase